MGPLISIIVPVYNTKVFLPDCIDSILGQSVTDVEILLIDDGSTDGSADICDEYAASDCRIKVFHQENAGVSSARNKGLREAKGEWIMFVDSDDWLEENAISTLLESSESGAELLVGSVYEDYCKDYSDGSSHLFSLSEDRDLLLGAWLVDYSYVSLCDDNEILKMNRITRGPCAKLYYKSAISGVYFDESVPLKEDNLFLYHFCKTIKNISFVNVNIYHYRHRERSAVRSVSGRDKAHEAYTASVYKLIDEKDSEFLQKVRDIAVCQDIFDMTRKYAEHKDKISDLLQYRALIAQATDSVMDRKALNGVRLSAFKRKGDIVILPLLKKRLFFLSLILVYCWLKITNQKDI